MRTITLLLALLLILGALPIGITAQNSEGYISQVKHNPVVPVINLNVTFSTVIRNITLSSITNVTLDIQDYNRFVMQLNSENKFEFVTSFNESRDYQYSVLLYVDNLLLEESGIHTISIQPSSGNAEYHFINHISQGLQRGNHSLSTEDGRFQLHLNLRRETRVNIDRVDYQSISEQPGMMYLTDMYDINLEDTEAVYQAELVLNYSNSVIDTFQIQPELLQLAYRNQSNGIWQIQEAVVNVTAQTLSATLDHFSEWIVTASLPQLRFVNSTTTYSSPIESYLTIPSIIKNFGSIPAKNISMRMIATPSVLLDNLSNQITITELSPLAEITYNWQLYLTQPGEYSIIFMVEADGVDGDVMQITITADNDNISSNTAETTFFIHYPVIIVMMSLIAYTIRKKS